VHLNPPEGKDVWLQAPQIFAGRKNYAVPFFELADMPENWYPHLARYDALLAASEHIAAAARNRLAIPVRHYPLATTVENVKPLDRSKVNIPEETFAFATTFDTDSGLNRKNGIGALRAFATAFGDRSDVVLVLKINGTAKHVELAAEIAKMRPGSVRVVDAYLPYAEVLGLYAACDAFVSLHRAEGLGLGLMEAMLLGKPVIATGWSGSMDFMDDASAALVRFTFTPVLDTQGAYAPRDFSRMQLWAEPDLLHAAKLMRRLADDRAYASALGAAGKVVAQTRFERFHGGGAAQLVRAL
jgi:glycosyltransferase involved in cell wall biosynthesis